MLRASWLVAVVIFAALSWPSTARAWPVYADSADDQTTFREAAPRGDGYFHVDTPRLVARLQELHVTTYAFLMWTSPSDWDDLSQEFLPAATQAGIEVWAYLVPPTEAKGKAIPPCQVDYICWAQQIGMLAQQSPNLTTIVLDDLNSNSTLFTPQNMAKIANAVRAYSPSLQILPVAYYPGNLYYLMNDYTNSISGTLFPYQDLDSTGELTHQMDVTCSLMKKPSPVLYLTAPAIDTSVAGDQVSLDTTVAALPGPNVIQFRVWDPKAGYAGTGPPGYRYAQLVVNGEVVWNRDMSQSFKHGWDEWSIDVTAQVAGGPMAAISFRLYDATDGVGAVDDTRIILDEGSGFDLAGATWAVSRVNAADYYAAAGLRDYHGRCVLLAYAGGMKAHPLAPTADYLGDALDIGHDEIVAGDADGEITYLLDKTPESVNFPPVAERYCAWTTDGGCAPAAADAGETGQLDGDLDMPLSPPDASCACAIGGRSARGERATIAIGALFAIALFVRRYRRW
jgi:hypothetical protein